MSVCACVRAGSVRKVCVLVLRNFCKTRIILVAWPHLHLNTRIIRSRTCRLSLRCCRTFFAFDCHAFFASSTPDRAVFIRGEYVVAVSVTRIIAAVAAVEAQYPRCAHAFRTRFLFIYLLSMRGGSEN